MAGDTYLAILGGLGLGSILTTAVQAILNDRGSRQKRSYIEKRTAYLGLLKSLYLSEVKPGPSSEKQYGLFLCRVTLVGSPEVAEAAQALLSTAPNTLERRRTMEKLLASMRHDLRVDVRSLK